MAVKPHTIDIVVGDMGRSLAFYRALGLDAPATKADAETVHIVTPGGMTLGLMAEAMVRQAMPGWQTPVGQRVTFACRCDDAAEVDAVYARVGRRLYRPQGALGAALRLYQAPGKRHLRNA